eukprot:6084375-Pleurochrysis_carterae.AAC.4
MAAVGARSRLRGHKRIIWPCYSEAGRARARGRDGSAQSGAHDAACGSRVRSCAAKSLRS